LTKWIDLKGQETFANVDGTMRRCAVALFLLAATGARPWLNVSVAALTSNSQPAPPASSRPLSSAKLF